MRIAILGSGSVGETLARRWREKGHETTFGSRDPQGEKASVLVAAGYAVATPAEAVSRAEVVVLAVPWGAVKETIAACGSLSGKTVLDCTNPLKPGLAGLEVGTDDSGGERVQKLARGARVVKIFNTTGANNMANPRLDGVPLTMFYAGDDAQAKATAARLASDLGFEPIDAGPLSAARLLEPLALLWISLAHKQGLGREIALQLLRRE